MTQVVGKSTPRVEGVAKVTGKAQYSADLQLPETLWGRCLRSPVPYARIKKIDTSKAAQVAGRKGGPHGLGRAGLAHRPLYLRHAGVGRRHRALHRRESRRRGRDQLSRRRKRRWS